MQGAEKLGGIQVEDLGDTFASGSKLWQPSLWDKLKYGKPPEAMVVRVNREDGVRDLRGFWKEVDRLMAEAEKFSL